MNEKKEISLSYFLTLDCRLWQVGYMIVHRRWLPFDIYYVDKNGANAVVFQSGVGCEGTNYGQLKQK